MRTRKEIEISTTGDRDSNWVRDENTGVILEVLLDIRDLLSPKKHEIGGIGKQDPNRPV